VADVEQIALVPSREPSDILNRAIGEHGPSRVYVLFSGGKDSSVTLDYLWRFHRERIDGALHISTGIGLQTTHDFVRAFCAERGIPLAEAFAPEGEYERMVREHGFPGPGQHRMAYIRLKERALDAFIRERKRHWLDRIGLVTGVRTGESRRRMGTCIDVRRDGAQVWIAPLIDWSNADMRRYREEHAVPMSPAAEALHHSYECLCGGMADLDDAQDEWFWIKAFAPTDPSVLLIDRLQRELAAAGHPRCRWGVKVEDEPNPVDLGMEPLFAPMCWECPLVAAGSAAER
jgi:3'-phosphoadenosine 5'-phosphosulfate sulfotransferase (PAPS reductase)/FAD synthetase